MATSPVRAWWSSSAATRGPRPAGRDHGVARGGTPPTEVVERIPEFGQWRHPVDHYAVFYDGDDGAALAAGTEVACALGRVDEPDAPWARAARPGHRDHGPDRRPPRRRCVTPPRPRAERVLGRPVDDPLFGSRAVIVAWGRHDGSIMEVHRYALDTMARILALILQWRQQVTGLRRAARRDPLTGLTNRTGFWEVLEGIGAAPGRAAGRGAVRRPRRVQGRQRRPRSPGRGPGAHRGRQPAGPRPAPRRRRGPPRRRRVRRAVPAADRRRRRRDHRRAGGGGAGGALPGRRPGGHHRRQRGHRHHRAGDGSTPTSCSTPPTGRSTGPRRTAGAAGISSRPPADGWSSASRSAYAPTVTDPATLVSDRLDQLLAELDPTTTDPVEFRGRQYDLGLAWVHFPEGLGGLDVAPNLQREVDRRLRAARAPSPRPSTSSASPWPDRRWSPTPSEALRAPPPAPDVHRGGGVVPAVQRARRRLRPGRPGGQGRARRRRVGHHRAEGVEHAGPPRRPGHARSPAPTPRRPSTRA